MGSDLVLRTSIVWGWHLSETRKLVFVETFDVLKNITIASAAAVASSRSDAFEIGRFVRSDTIVWKFNKASSRPWLISAWYGVYWVYQPGFSSILRLITPGRWVL